uniref:Uncharacterized protein n=1 Tax=Aegilops tauschii subsp. strangulata TaxID=200361 RepID=A0A453RUR2_AEGTS
MLLRTGVQCRTRRGVHGCKINSDADYHRFSAFKVCICAAAVGCAWETGLYFPPVLIYKGIFLCTPEIQV